MNTGMIIKEWLVKHSIPVKDFAKMIPCTRESAYKILNKSCINSDLLLRISIVLEHDFFADCSKRIRLGYNVAKSDTKQI